MHNGVGQHTNATQTSRAIATLRSLGRFRPAGGNVVFPKAPVNVVSGRNLPRKWPLKESGESENRSDRQPSPATAPPNIFTAILEGRPYPVKALINFGSEHDYVHGRFPTGARSVSCRRLRRGYGAVHDSRPSFVIMSCRRRAFWIKTWNIHRAEGKLHMQYRPAVVAPWRNAFRYLDYLRARQTSVWDRIFGKATSRPPTSTSLNRRASHWRNSGGAWWHKRRCCARYGKYAEAKAATLRAACRIRRSNCIPTFLHCMAMRRFRIRRTSYQSGQPAGSRG